MCANAIVSVDYLDWRTWMISTIPYKAPANLGFPLQRSTKYGRGFEGGYIKVLIS